MIQSLRLAGPLCLLLVALPAPTPPDAKAASLAPPNTMRGVLRYKVRGLSAVQGGFLSSIIFGFATGVGMQSAMFNTVKLLAGAGKLSGNPSMAEMHKYLSTGKGFDFSGAPVSAGYDIHLDFVLEGDKKGDYRLKSGSASYSGNTDADFTIGGKGGNIHRFTDRLRGQGTAILTPENASITLTFEGKGEDRRAKFEVGVNFPVTVQGKTIWSAMGGLIVITKDNNATHMISPFGPPMIDKSSGVGTSDWPASVVYSRSGPLDSVLRGRETWQDLTDSGELVEWELFDVCRAVIVDPKKNGRLVFNDKTPAKIDKTALADVTPGVWGDALAWRLPRLTGSTVRPDPVDANGAELPFSYEKMPGKSGEFGEKLFEASFGEAGGKGGCKNPPLHPVRFFFSRDAFNGPDPSEPNWFWYWKQTKAGQGFSYEMLYGGRTVDLCANGRTRGFFSMTGKGDHFYICDLTPDNFTKRTNMTLTFRAGIDKFASTVRHEATHMKHYQEWWLPRGGFNAETMKLFDPDKDGIPTEVEIAENLDPHDYDTWNVGWDDEHFLTLMAEDTWQNGTADKEDWACPGKQWGMPEECR